MTESLFMDGPQTLSSAFAGSLEGRKLGREKGEADELLTGYIILHRRFHRTLRRFMKSLDDIDPKMRDSRDQSNGLMFTAVLDDYLSTLYAATELFEFYEQDVPGFLTISGKEHNVYRNKIGVMKREASAICNKCKHNHAYLQQVRIDYNNSEYADGFCTVQRIDGIVRINRNIHKQKEAFSFNWSLRRVFGNIMLADVAAAALVAKRPDLTGASPIVSVGYVFPYEAEIQAILRRPMVGMPLEPTSPSLMAGQNLMVDGNSMIQPSRGSGTMKVTYDLLGSDIEFEVPYADGTTTASLRSEEGLPMLVAGFVQATLTVVLPEIHA
jgi:hypothetical protein